MQAATAQTATAQTATAQTVAPSALAAFLAGYRAALAFSSSDWSDDPNGRQLETLEGFEFSPSARAQTAADCRAFIADNLPVLAEAASRPGYDWERAGQDFWLTRCGHGAGYWDRSELYAGELGDLLTDAANTAGEQWPYIGEDDLLYLA